jgi:hypothetical protein
MRIISDVNSQTINKIQRPNGNGHTYRYQNEKRPMKNGESVRCYSDHATHTSKWD